MKVAVTGGAGQLGTAVLRRLAAERSVTELLCIDLRPPAVASGKLRYVRSDVRDPDLAQTLAGCHAVVHLAFIVTGRPSRALFDEVNVGGSKNVFRAAVAAGVRQLIYSSSIAAYGVVPGHPQPIRETTPRVYQPDFAYAAAKYQVEEFLDGLEAECPSLAVVRMRPTVCLGAAMDNPLGRLLRRRRILDTGDVPLALVWDEDVAQAIVLALKRGIRGAFNLAASDAQTGAELASTGLSLIRLSPWLARALVAGSGLLSRAGIGEAIDPAWTRAAGVTMLIDSTKAAAELGWKPLCPTTRSVAQRFLTVVPTRLDPRIAGFFRLVRMAARRAPPLAEVKHVDARIHLRLTGVAGGDIGLLVQSGRLSITRAIPRPPTVTVTIQAATFLRLLAGSIDFGTAQLTGKVQVEGEALAAMVVQALLAMFCQRVPLSLRRWLFASRPRDPHIKGVSA